MVGHLRKMNHLRRCSKMLCSQLCHCGKFTQHGLFFLLPLATTSGLGAAKFISTTPTNVEIRQKRNELFSKELERQQSLVTRVEKIEVCHIGLPEECTLMMNRHISTPLDCARHIHEMLTQRSALAEVNGRLWDMNRPLEENCELRLFHFKDKDPHHVNQAFWRSCSFLLGLVLDKAFKDDIHIILHSWPKPSIQSGYFAHDIALDLDWVPKVDELRVLTGMFRKLASAGHKFERLEVEMSVAMKMFEGNPFKSSQIPDIASTSPAKTVTLYRVDDHIDISIGPMIADTSHLGMVQVVAAHPVIHDSVSLSRFRGVALPKQLPLNHFAWGILVDRAKKGTAIPSQEIQELNRGTDSEDGCQEIASGRP